jgi:hypothetical protein
MPKRSGRKQQREGGIIWFLPGIISAIKSNEDHKRRVRDQAAAKSALYSKYANTPQAEYGHDQLIEFDDTQAKAKEHVRTTKMQEEAIANAEKNYAGEQAAAATTAANSNQIREQR